MSEITNTFSDKYGSIDMSKTIEKTVISRIYGRGRGWVFSKKDFAVLGEGGNIDRTLSRMAEKGLIRPVMRGLYDYPA